MCLSRLLPLVTHSVSGSCEAPAVDIRPSLFSVVECIYSNAVPTTQHQTGSCLKPSGGALLKCHMLSSPSRSALRKVYEHDDTPAKTMVLCVCKINTLSTERMQSAPFRSEGGSTTVDEV